MSSEDEISQLRLEVKNQPDDARSMALLATGLAVLANTLAGQKVISKIGATSSSSSSSSTHDQYYDEALRLAKKSIELAPAESIGYAALSVIPTVLFQERMLNLRKAVDLEQEALSHTANNISHRVAIASSLVRFLIAPREEMARREKQKSSAKGIMRKELCLNEQGTYQELCTSLEDAKNIIWKRREEKYQNMIEYQQNSIPINMQRLARLHYRLGIFFRTMNPKATYQATSRYHLLKLLELLNPPFMCSSFELKVQSTELSDLGVKSKFWLATLQHQDEEDNNVVLQQVDRCPSDYVVGLYSTFANTFDDQLVNKLKYKTPTKLRQLVDDVLLSSSSSSGLKSERTNAADLGCGTGLSGVAFQSLSEYLVGVDLSPAMVAKAQERGCYNELHTGDVENILTGSNAYDLIFACDVFCYIGNLQSIFISVANSLTEQGFFAFSVEMLDEGKKTVNGCGYLVHSSARWAHKESYITHLAQDNGLKIRAIKKDVIRKNRGTDVKGILAVLSLK